MRYPFNKINTPTSSTLYAPPYPHPHHTPKTPPSFTPYLEHCPTWPTGKTRYAPPAATCLKKQLITSRRNPVQKPLLPKISIYQESGTFTINCELGTIKNRPVPSRRNPVQIGNWIGNKSVHSSLKPLSLYTCIFIAEMQKVAYAADISVLFFSAGANFWAILGHF